MKSRENETNLTTKKHLLHGFMLISLMQLITTVDSFIISSSTRQSVFGSSWCGDGRKCKNGILMNNHSDENDIDIKKRSILNNTLLSVDTCVKLYERFVHDENSSDAQERIVFIDASWWHKGDLNGRAM